MRILHITSSFLPVIGGQEKVVEELAKNLKNLKHNITILTTNLLCEKANLPKYENLNGIKIIRCKNDFFLGGYGYSKEAIRWLNKNWGKFDVIHSHGYNRFLSEFAVYYLKNKKPVVFTPHGFIHTKKNYFFKMVHDLTFGRVIKHASICTALTKLDLREYARRGVKKERIKEVPNGINDKFLDKINKKESDDFKKRQNIKQDYLLYVGRIHKSKGLQYVIKSIENLNCLLVIVGQDAGYKKKVIRLAKRLDVEDKIFFLGQLSEKELLRAYKSCKIFVLFSEWEGFGIAVLEAMAAGKPVIVSDKGSLPLLVKDKENGYVVEFKDVKKLKERINLLLENKKIREELGKKGRDFSRNYLWKNIARVYEKMYQEIK